MHTPQLMMPVRWMLLVEDDLEQRVLIEEAVRRLDLPVAVYEAGDVYEAVHWIRDRSRVNGGLEEGVVVLDLGLPGPHGFRLLEWMQDNPPLNSLPVVVLTASENPLDAEHAFNLGARGYFRKPRDFTQYQGIFQRVLRIAGAAADSA